MKKWQSITAAAALCSLIFSGCASSTPASDGGSVYFLNFKPEAAEAWQQLAQNYTQETGTPVLVETAGDNKYEQTLQKDIDAGNAPTLFQVNGPAGLKRWKDYAYNLYGTPVFNQLSSDDFALYEGKDDVAAIAYLVETYGIAVNTSLLEKAGYTLDDIQSFADLARIAQSITEHSQELGFSAFASSGLDEADSWIYAGHLANMPIYFEYQDRGISETDEIEGEYLDNFRDIIDLYVENSIVPASKVASVSRKEALEDFAKGKAVFFQTGSWEYNDLIDAGMKPQDLGMIPLYIGAGDESRQGLVTGTENYWVVNKKADEKDIQATLDFMDWCVTSPKATEIMKDKMGFSIPFKDARSTDNVFIKEDLEMLAAGKTPISWAFTTIPSQEWKSGLAKAIDTYINDPTDENWQKVSQAYIENWKTEYEKAGS